MMKQISTEIQRREATGGRAKKNSGKNYCPYSLIFDPTRYVPWPAGFSGFVFPTSGITEFSKEGRVVGWRTCSTSPAPGEGRCCWVVGASSSSSSLRWRPQPMIPGYLRGGRVGNKGRKREGTHTCKTRVALSLRHRYSRKGKLL